MLRRRDFLLGCGGVAASALVAPIAGEAAQTVPAGVAPFSRSLRKANFRALLNQPVRIRRPDGAIVRTRLVEVRDGLPAPRLEQFSVFLRGPRGVPLASGLYTVEHPVAGAAQVFLDPARIDRWSRFYRANFSLLLGA